MILSLSKSIIVSKSMIISTNITIYRLKYKCKYNYKAKCIYEYKCKYKYKLIGVVAIVVLGYPPPGFSSFSWRTYTLYYIDSKYP